MKRVIATALGAARRQFSIHSVVGYWWPVGVTPSSQGGSTKASARK